MCYMQENLLLCMPVTISRCIFALTDHQDQDCQKADWPEHRNVCTSPSDDETLAFLSGAVKVYTARNMDLVSVTHYFSSHDQLSDAPQISCLAYHILGLYDNPDNNKIAFLNIELCYDPMKPMIKHKNFFNGIATYTKPFDKLDSKDAVTFLSW
jgi:hypothetical protein